MTGFDSQIIQALRDSHYLWRTPTGIASASGIPQNMVWEFLNNSDLVAKAATTNEKGQPLFALRDRLRKEVGLGRRVVDTMLNRPA
jgi:hypothetical protein